MGKRTIFIIALLAAGLFVLASCSKKDAHGGHDSAKAPEPAAGPEAPAVVDAGNTVCPVMGNPVNKDIFVVHEGRKIYFCCAGCPEEFKKDPDKYLKKLEASAEPEAKPGAEHHETEDPKGEHPKAEPMGNTTCPVMEGKPVRKDLYVDYNGRRVYLCCKGCVRAFKEDPEKYMSKLK